MDPLRTGLALALTVAIGYTGCAAVAALFPGPFMDFMNGLFHGLDFSPLASRSRLFSLSGYLTALCVMFVWALLIGALFATLANRFGAREAAH